RDQPGGDLDADGDGEGPERVGGGRPVEGRAPRGGRDPAHADPAQVRAARAVDAQGRAAQGQGHAAARRGGRARRSHSRLGRGGVSEVRRCWDSADPAYVEYHDLEWGRPVTDERGLYERLCLEGFQSGLSWLTILRKRAAFRTAFADFDPEAVAEFGPRDVERLLGDAGIVRHRGKIEAAIANARATLALREAGSP